MNNDLERNLGAQPIVELLAQHKLTPHDLVAVSNQQLTHKMVSRAAKGRWLTPNAKAKVLTALNQATGKNYSLTDLFNY
jgi:hypothetical protein